MELETSHKAEKSTLRTLIRQRRKSIDPDNRPAMDATIRQHLITLVENLQATSIAAFVAFDGEPELTPALLELVSNGIEIALPVVEPTPGRPTMQFRRWSAEAAMGRNRYGIPEPRGTGIVQVPEIDMVLLPLVGWDHCGSRLGMGAGYYDRALQPFAQMERPLRVGVGYRVQRVEALPAEPWDIRLHGMLTESGWTHFNTENQT